MLVQLSSSDFEVVVCRLLGVLPLMVSFSIFQAGRYLAALAITWLILSIPNQRGWPIEQLGRQCLDCAFSISAQASRFGTASDSHLSEPTIKRIEFCYFNGLSVSPSPVFHVSRNLSRTRLALGMNPNSIFPIRRCACSVVDGSIDLDLIDQVDVGDGRL